MATSKLVHDIQLSDISTGQHIIGSGGTIAVCEAGSTALLALLDPDDLTTALTNPLTPTMGRARFAVADTVASVDIYGIAPGGQAFRCSGIAAGSVPRVGVDLAQSHYTLCIPFDHADYTDAVEKDSGFDEPANALFLPNPTLWIKDIDATETIDVGTATAETGDPNGFLAAASVGTLGLVKGSVIASAHTMGALFSVLDSANAGDDAPEGHVSTGKSIVYTLTTGCVLAAGVICLPYVLVPNPTT